MLSIRPREFITLLGRAGALLKRYVNRPDRSLKRLLVAFIAVIFLQYWWNLQLVWLGLPLGVLLWFLCHSSSSIFYKATAKTLLPWIIGWAIVVITYLFILMWLPEADRSWIIFAQSAADRAERILDKAVPHSIFVSVMLLAFLFTINVLRPSWKKLTHGFQQILAATKAVASVIAVFTSVSFFGDGQLPRVINAINQEKHDRTSAQFTAQVELIFVDRLTQKETLDAESRDVHKYLDSI
jgi:hypothetical protein